jgi:hypothetical protein
VYVGGDHRRSLCDHVPFALELEHLDSRFNVDPSSLIDLVIVIGDVARFAAHQEEMYELVIPDSLSVSIGDEPVFDRFDRSNKIGNYPRFFANFTQRGFLDRLTRIDNALRELPTHFRYDSHYRDFRAPLVDSKNYTAGGHLLERSNIFIVA